MKKFVSALTLISTLFISILSIAADEVEWISTDEARKNGTLQSDTPSVDDPYMNKQPTKRDYEGHPLTQGPYENCASDQCQRAEKRQTTEGTTWRDDVKSGAKKGGY